MPEDPEPAIDPSRHLRMIPVLALGDRALVDVVCAGALRAGAGPEVLIMPRADEAALIAARDAGAEVVVVVCEGEAAVGSLNAARRLGGRAIPVLALTNHDGVPRVSRASLALLGGDDLLDVNVPVPAIDDDGYRTALWDQLRAARVEERHHLVEVDGAPAIAELASSGRGHPADAWAALSAGAAGVLAGRMAAAGRRWRGQLDA